MQIFTASAEGWMRYGDVEVRCAVGKSGLKEAGAKREGDGASPIGVWPIRQVLWRADKGPKPETAFVVQELKENDGWCDASEDLNYNKFVSHTYPASAERLWRDDHVYDIIVVLGHNDSPVVAAMGSCIFLHCARPDYSGTEGCAALADQDLRDLLRVAKPGDAVAFAL